MLISLFTSGYSIDIILILMVAILISATLSIVVHEISHGGVAFLFGDPTAKLNNRLTLNPLAHFDLIGHFSMIVNHDRSPPAEMDSKGEEMMNRADQPAVFFRQER